MDLVEIGWIGKPHGLKGEIKIRVSEFYEDDLFNTQSVLIGSPPVPYFVESLRAGGAVIGKFEGLDAREQVAPLSNRPLFLLAEHVTATGPEEDETPWDIFIGYTISAEGYPVLGPITGIVDLPQHYLAELTHEGKEVVVPLHEDLIERIDQEGQVLTMVLPEGLLNI